MAPKAKQSWTMRRGYSGTSAVKSAKTASSKTSKSRSSVRASKKTK